MKNTVSALEGSRAISATTENQKGANKMMNAMSTKHTTKRMRENDVKKDLSRLPHKAGIYLFKDDKGAVIYVGKAKDLRNRVGNYFHSSNDGRYHIQFMLPRICQIDFTVTKNEQEALILENNLIKKHRPRYNIFLRDDKTYVNLRLNMDHPFPRLTIVRNPRRDKALYFGPFPSAGAVRQTLRTLGKIFPLRLCSDAELRNRTRPCLYYHIKRCPAPCVDLVDHQAYKETVNKVAMFLKGRGKELIKSCREKMELASAERRYEEAAMLRDQIRALRLTLEKQRITSPQKAQRDIFAAFREGERMAVKALYVRDGKVSGQDTFLFTNASHSTAEHLASFINQYYQRGALVPEEVIVSEEIEEKEALEELLREKRRGAVKVIRPLRGERRKLLDLAIENAKAAFESKAEPSRNRELLEDLRALLELRNFPRRMECFDISNIQGQEAVGSRVTFIEGEPARDLYRRYRIKSVSGADDYAMMEEILRRRIARGLREGDLPDLLAVDGGRGQLNVALRVLESLGAYDIDVLAIAKVREKAGGKRISGKERIYTKSLSQPLLLEGNSPALFLLERIRDEAHRFAVSYHKKVSGKKLTASLLDEVPGVGPKLKAKLLEHFGSVSALRRAFVYEIAGVTGVSETLAARIKAFLGGE